MKYTIIASPLGELTIATNGTAITALHIEGDRYFTAVPDSWVLSEDDLLLQQAEKELQEYFSGTRKSFDVPLFREGTAFQNQVWQALLEIPLGQTSAYSSIAEKIGKPKAVRAVGTAIGKNPICILVPCHRVLASSGGLGGYVAGLECKEKLLNLELSY